MLKSILRRFVVARRLLSYLDVVRILVELCEHPGKVGDHCRQVRCLCHLEMFPGVLQHDPKSLLELFGSFLVRCEPCIRGVAQLELLEVDEVANGPVFASSTVHKLPLAIQCATQ